MVLHFILFQFFNTTPTVFYSLKFFGISGIVTIMAAVNLGNNNSVAAKCKNSKALHMFSLFALAITLGGRYY